MHREPDVPTCIFRRELDPSALVVEHPPVLAHPNKRLAFELACALDAVHRGSITVTQWAAGPLPARAMSASTRVEVVPDVYDYAGETKGVWHVNFADPRLFIAYGSGLLAQDELMCVEHPLLGSVREALIAQGHSARTVDERGATPVLVSGVERRCTLDTRADFEAGRMHGLYGRRFASAPRDVIAAALHAHAAPRPSNVIAMAAPSGGSGAYFPSQIAEILTTAFTAFSAARIESQRSRQGDAIEVRTGFWGCGAFGGNRRTMTLLQLLAARMAGVDGVRFYAVDASGVADFREGASDLERVLDAGTDDEPLEDLIERVADLDYEWGVSDGS